ncbi:MAG: anaerobic ribonucleoside-triphosphate reductase activating protein [Eubacteriales bacterium]|nr:anaerobic ribonucleoside-triphosphate reductase activating protein [Eubacteriales bacterium]
MIISGLLKTTLLDFPGRVACTVFTGGCNLRCPFCHNSDLLDMGLESEYSEEEVLEFIKKRGSTLEGVAITGGEPTLQKDLPEFLRKVKEMGLETKLDTNGINPGMVKQLIDEGLVNYIAMDIKAGEANYANVCGINEKNLRFDLITKTKDLILEGRVPYEFRTTVVGGLHSVDDFEAIGKYIEGAENYFLQCYKDSGNILDKQAGFYSPSADDMVLYRDMVAPFVKKATVRGIDIDV